MTGRELATRLVALRIVKDWIAQADADTRSLLLLEAVQGERIAAVVPGPEGPVTVGTVTATKGKAGSVTATVTDEHALLRWCREHKPDAVTETVRATDQRVLLDIAKAGGWADENGEMQPIPGISVFEPVDGKAGLMVKPSEDAEVLIRQAVATGELSLADLTAIDAA